MFLCPNKMIGMRPRNTSVCNEDLSELAALWRDDPVHPTATADKKMANTIIADISSLYQPAQAYGTARGKKKNKG
jgi:hypothetical protein